MQQLGHKPHYPFFRHGHFSRNRRCPAANTESRFSSNHAQINTTPKNEITRKGDLSQRKQKLQKLHKFLLSPLR